jgi:predicted transcriptional regulator
MAEKKSVLNVTVSESLAEAVRQLAAIRGSTISSVVEAALAEQIKWHRIREDGLAAAEEEYAETGYPTPEEKEAVRAQVAEELRIMAEARAAREAQRARPAGAA